MSAIQAIKDYYSMLGPHGVLLAASARLSRRFTEVMIQVPDIKYPIRARLRTSDLSVIDQVLIIKEYACEFADPPKVIVDGGANIGLTSVFYANRFPRAKILAVEPEYSNFALLEQNTKPYRNVTAIRAALWSENGEVTLVDPGKRHYGFQTMGEPSLLAGINCGNVPAITVEKLIEDYALDYIDLLKLDIEGSERELFKEPSAWIKKVGAMAIELHDRMRPGCSENFIAASKEFKTVCQKGETLFVAREKFCDAEVSGSELKTGFRVPPSCKRLDRIVCKIVGTCTT